MGGALWNFLCFCIVLGILVTFHEFGHYLAARWCGVRVYRFCLGFGPVIFRKMTRRGEEFAIALLPLGGYVKMKGEGETPTASSASAASASAASSQSGRWGNLGRPDTFETDFAQVRTGTKADSAYSTVSLEELACEVGGNDSFAEKKIWQRTLIIAAGPVFNIILAFFLYIVINLMGTTAHLPVVDNIVPGSLAQQAGLRNYDLIKEIDGRTTYTAGEAWMTLGSFAGKTVEVTVADDFGRGAARTVTLDLRGFDLVDQDFFSYLGLSQSWGRTTEDISFIEANTPAAQAGLLPGDIILAVDGVAVDGFAAAVTVLKDNLAAQQAALVGPRPEKATEAYIEATLEAPYQPITFEILRRHWAQGTLPVDPAADVAANDQDAFFERGRDAELSAAWYDGLRAVAQARATVPPTSSEVLSVSVPVAVTVTESGAVQPRLGLGAITLDSDLVWTKVHYGPLETIAKSFDDTINASLLIFRALESLVVGDVGIKAVSGPVAIATIAGQTASLGLSHFLLFLALLSINLGWMNLIPIPVLDGGQLLFLLYEKVVGRPPSERAQRFLSLLGLSLIVGLTMIAIFNDLTYFWL